MLKRLEIIAVPADEQRSIRSFDFYEIMFEFLALLLNFAFDSHACFFELQAGQQIFSGGFDSELRENKN